MVRCHVVGILDSLSFASSSCIFRSVHSLVHHYTFGVDHTHCTLLFCPQKSIGIPLWLRPENYMVSRSADCCPAFCHSCPCRSIPLFTFAGDNRRTCTIASKHRPKTGVGECLYSSSLPGRRVQQGIRALCFIIYRGPGSLESRTSVRILYIHSLGRHSGEGFREANLRCCSCSLVSLVTCLNP